MTRRGAASHGTPWEEAVREVSAARLEEEARRSTSPYTLLAAWRGDRGVPAYVMLKLLRRRLADSRADLTRSPFPAPPLQRAHDILAELWAWTGRNERHPIWQLVELFLRVTSERGNQGGTQCERDERGLDQRPPGDKTQVDF